MLFSVGMLAGKSWRSRWGYAAIAFGIWDIFYYVFLKVLCGWPNSLLDWDILFLLPLPWWGPVLSPVLISLLMICWGTLTCACEAEPTRPRENRLAWAMNGAGMLLALYVFMEHAIKVASHGEEAIRQVLPARFNWPLFSLALLLMAAPIVTLLWGWLHTALSLAGPCEPAGPSLAAARVELARDLDCANRS
jgi:hypothetical protein